MSIDHDCIFVRSFLSDLSPILSDHLLCPEVASQQEQDSLWQLQLQQLRIINMLIIRVTRQIISTYITINYFSHHMFTHLMVMLPTMLALVITLLHPIAQLHLLRLKDFDSLTLLCILCFCITLIILTLDHLLLLQLQLLLLLQSLPHLPLGQVIQH